MSWQTFGDIVVNKKEFHASKQAIALNLVNTNKIVVSEQQSRLYNQPIYDDKYIKTKVKKHLVALLIHSSQTMKIQEKETITLVLQQFVLILY